MVVTLVVVTLSCRQSTDQPASPSFVHVATTRSDPSPTSLHADAQPLNSSQDRDCATNGSVALSPPARFARHCPGDRWFVDETYVKVNGVWRYAYRAIDQYGQVIDVLLSVRRDAQSARQFFTRALRTLKLVPSEVVTDAAAVYPTVLDEPLPRRGITSSSTPTMRSRPITASSNAG